MANKLVVTIWSLGIKTISKLLAICIPFKKFFFQKTTQNVPMLSLLQYPKPVVCTYFVFFRGQNNNQNFKNKLLACIRCLVFAVTVVVIVVVVVAVVVIVIVIVVVVVVVVIVVVVVVLKKQRYLCMYKYMALEQFEYLLL
jgi:hypothetical protein